MLSTTVALRPLPGAALSAVQACCALADYIPVTTLAGVAAELLGTNMAVQPWHAARAGQNNAAPTAAAEQPFFQERFGSAIKAGLSLAEAVLQRCRRAPGGLALSDGDEHFSSALEGRLLPGHDDVQAQIVHAVAPLVGSEASATAERCLVLALPSCRGQPSMTAW